MSAGLVLLKAIAFVLGMSALALALIFLAGGFMGAGHGSSYFILALVAPFGGENATAPLGMLLWPLIVVLVVYRRSILCRASAALVLIIHYLGIIILPFQTDWSDVRRVWNVMPVMVILFAGLYLVSQIILWSRILKRNEFAAKKITTANAAP